MNGGITIRVIERDPDYLGIDVEASNLRCRGSARIYAGLDELAEFAARVCGFPSSPADARDYEFGSRDPKIAGGFCRLEFRCKDSSGHVEVAVEIEDDTAYHSPSSASLILRTEPAAIDLFLDAVGRVNRTGSGFACLSATS